MHMRLLAVGDRQPEWVDSAVDAYLARLPRAWQFSLDCIATASRKRGASSTAAVNLEGEKLLARLRRDERVVLLDERGLQFSSRELAGRISAWENDGRDVALIVGGPDGVADSLRQRAELEWSLSKLTMPHGIARILVVEQLYRAWSLSAGHPYHRD